METEQKVYDFLRAKGQLEDIDETLIKELIFNIELIEQCKSDIRLEGYKINITQNAKKKPYWFKNQSFICYQACLKNINTILISLGLTIKERQKLKLALEDPDNFDKIMSM